MSTWLFDLGNTRLKCARLDDAGRLQAVRALAHGEDGFAEALDATLPQRAEVACVASVASPALTLQLLQRLGTRFRRISIARTQSRLSGVRIAYADPSKLGVDRFLALLAAHAMQAGPQLVVGVGTALTLDLLDAEGLHRGGLIAPSPRLMRLSLHEAAAQLPAAGGEVVDFATDTAGALASGCQSAALGLLERSLRLAQERLGTAPCVLLHGGGADELQTQLPRADRVPDLVLRGLAIWVGIASTAS
ncbi:pantothenate kinase [Pseudoxanthomonas kalamensis DSM 18571]|uniref:type III pantothenate kinase n=1 Tax=Pseudoxanthomonas kalamensis TaxID=289483 RepID=UPI0013919758|nr:type III pantothenate kinase [Pseudoxanthomonas kalamensis]KAF1711976.1 pantothenate kinase [Pseudoxanthomonas kalamensis DSM 18571]